MMNDSTLKLAEMLVPSTYIRQAADSRASREKKIRILIEQRKCPDDGWDDATIELLVNDLALMDSNNFTHNCGVGEREARIFSGLVKQRHFKFGHGIGRSGDIAEVQPKAAGSSLLNKLTNSLVLDILQSAGVPKAASCLVVPLGTGMTIMMCLLALRQHRPDAKYVLWPRIDQKSCFKCILTSGFQPIIIENIVDGYELRTNVNEIEEKINTLGPNFIGAVLTTTSCFAPRGIDRLEEVAVLCSKYEVPHLINNAYGVQSSKCMHHIQQAARLGRVDAFIQSTDKNFMVPVGGAIVAGFNDKFVDSVGKMYPGRASISPLVDLFITLLSMGKNGYKQLIQEQKNVKIYLTNEMRLLMKKHKLIILENKNNPISIAMTVPLSKSGDPTLFGSMLFLRGVSGARVVNVKEKKIIRGIEFLGWGSHCSNYPHSYFTAAASIGMTKEEVDVFVQRLDKCLTKFAGKNNIQSVHLPD